MNKFFSHYLPLTLVATGVVAMARADVKDRLYDFTDAYYTSNGVMPEGINGRREAVAPLAIADTPIFSFQRNVRALFTIGAWSDNGSPVYYTVLGELSGNSFTNNSAGINARTVADRSAEYIFPKKGTDPMGLGSPRQPFMLDLSNGYFSNNKLGIWIHTFVNFTDKAFNTADGKKAMTDMAKKNGLALDGTPILRTKSDIEGMFSKGYVTKQTPPFQQSGRYAICPVIKDPTDGGIAPDQWLFQVKNADGTAMFPAIEQNFLSLQKTGRWL